jgi:hypothetical protein
MIKVFGILCKWVVAFLFLKYLQRNGKDIKNAECRLAFVGVAYISK